MPSYNCVSVIDTGIELLIFNNVFIPCLLLLLCFLTLFQPVHSLAFYKQNLVSCPLWIFSFNALCNVVCQLFNFCSFEVKNVAHKFPLI